MGKRLYVGNLSYNTSDNDLQTLFAEAGEVVEARVVTDRDSGRSKGFGFVEMGDDAAATKAIETFNGKNVDGRDLKVAEARPRNDSRGGGGGGRGFGGGGGGFGGGGSRW